MRILILGGKGMAGHVISTHFASSDHFEVIHTTRKKDDLDGVFLDARDFRKVQKVIDRYRPDVVVNAIGVLNRDAEMHPVDAILLNSMLPRVVAQMLDLYGGKLVHISTDCVFKGDLGDYREDADTDGTSVYAKTKSLGEVVDGPHLTVRTSIIGPELKDGIGLFHWFMKQKGEVHGFSNVMWNGVTTLELAKAIEAMLNQNLSGLYQLTAPEKISKYALLKIIKDIYGKENVTIVPADKPVLDRTLCSTRTDFQYTVPDYSQMLGQLKDWMT